MTTTITDDDLDLLEKRARAATQGPHRIERRDSDGGEITYIVYAEHDVAWVSEGSCPKARVDALYIATATPVTVLGLIARLRGAESEVARLRSAQSDPIEEAINEHVTTGDGVIAALRGGS